MRIDFGKMKDKAKIYSEAIKGKALEGFEKTKEVLRAKEYVSSISDREELERNLHDLERLQTLIKESPEKEDEIIALIESTAFLSKLFSEKIPAIREAGQKDRLEQEKLQAEVDEQKAKAERTRAEADEHQAKADKVKQDTQNAKSKGKIDFWLGFVKMLGAVIAVITAAIKFLPKKKE